jgi:Protein of unknown function (DUF664)
VALVLSFYRDQCERANALLASTPLSSRPRGRAYAEIADEVSDLRWIVLHMIEETARHAGHLDIAREDRRADGTRTALKTSVFCTRTPSRVGLMLPCLQR